MSQGSVIVVHPGVQHSRELARALHRGGLLARLITSINGGFSGASLLPAAVRRKLRTRTAEGVPNSLVTLVPYFEAVTWLLQPVLGARSRERLSYAALDLFDKRAAKIVADLRPRIVVGFENGCRHTFRRAKTQGVQCVLDAASVHYSAQPTNDGAREAALEERIRKSKDEELELADHVVVLSTYARDTYAAAGVPAQRISIVPPGASLSISGLVEPPAERRDRSMRFLFAGNVKLAKGVDLLLEAFARLQASDKQLTIAGPLVDEALLPANKPDHVEYVGKLAPEALYRAYANSDIVVLPSRADGFGFVVAEAMRCGRPVIVSSSTGAKDLVAEGVNGWIFQSGSADDLLRAMQLAISRRSSLAEMGARARSAVADLTWEAYGIRIRDLYSRLLTPG